MKASIQQIELVAGIFQLLNEQHPGITASTRQYNAIIRAANQIVAAFDKEDTLADDNIGLDAWLASDSVGLSSRFMAMYLSGRVDNTTAPHPSDPSDFARCRTLLKAVPDLVQHLQKMREASAVWAELVTHWDEICRLMDDESPDWRNGAGSAPKTYDFMKSLGC
jgi:hypothetical protein